MAAAQHRALRSVSAYRTVSRDAAVVVAGISPADLLASVRCMAYDARRAADQTATSLSEAAAGNRPCPSAIQLRTTPSPNGRAWTLRQKTAARGRAR